MDSDFSFLDFNLFELAKSGCFSVLNLALDNLEIYEFDVNYQDVSGNTILHYVAGKGNVEMTEKLLHLKAFIHILNERKETPLHSACIGGHLDVVIVLLKNGARLETLDYLRETPLFKGIRSRNEELIKYLLSKGAKKDYFNKAGENILHLSIMFKVKCVTEEIIQNEAFAHTPTSYGDSPLQLAMNYNNYEAFQQLCSKNADLTERNRRNQYTLLHIATSKNLINICENLLLSKKIDVNSSDVEGSTALHIAAESNFYKIAELLIEHGANVNQADHDGYTPFHVAASQNDNKEIMLTLLKNGAKVDAQTIHGDMPIHRAAASGNTKALILLFSRKYINCKNKYGVTPVDLARDCGNRYVREFVDKMECASSTAAKRVSFASLDT